MTRKLLTAVVLVAACAGAVPAQAASPSSSFRINGTVPSKCMISGASGPVSFGALTDSNGAYTASGVSKVATDTNAGCNGVNTNATISRTNLFTTNSASGTFVNVIPMGAKLTTTPQNVTLNDTSTLSATSISPSAGTSGKIGQFTGLTVTATLGSIGSNRPVSGSYGASITITLSPAS